MSTDSPSSKDRLVVELCAETAEACRAAVHGGAHRIELCTHLAVGGLTPSRELVETALQAALPVHVLLRPTAATFLYSPELYAELKRSLLTFKHAGVAGFVLGMLTPTGYIDVEHTRALVELAHPLPVTFHRAFDETTDLPHALEAVIAAGCTRVLTSGGAPDVVAGASVLASLVQQARGRIDVAAGGGLRLANAKLVATRSHAHHFHASLREPEPIPGLHTSTLVERLQELLQRLRAARPPTLDNEATDLYTTAGIGANASGSRTGR